MTKTASGHIEARSARYLDATPTRTEGSALDITWRQHLDLSPSEHARRLSGARALGRTVWRLL